MLQQNLVSFHIIERESYQESLITWTYPTITDDTATYMKTRCFQSRYVDKELFFYLRRNNQWMYVKHFLNNGKATCLVVLTQELFLDKYKLLCDILVKKYIKTKNPVELVKLYIKLISGRSAIYQENGTELGINLKTFTSEMGVKDLIRDFGLEIVLIYNGILLKRRILVYHSDIEKLQQKLVPITCLIPIRNLREHLFPWIESINELKGVPFYMAGTTEENVESNERYYDLYVNLVGNEISVSKAAKECFVMAKIHKEMAHFLIQLSQSELSETKVIEEIENKTNDIIQQLYSIRTDKKMVTMNDLKSKKFNVPLENFLFNLAVAENIMML